MHVITLTCWVYAELLFDKRKYRVAAENAQEYGQWLSALSAGCSSA
jgi:hypothetical protein